MTERIAIVGAGLAGVTAAETIRKKDSSVPITVFGDEDMPFYTRIRLPELVAGKLERKKLMIKKLDWYENKGIDLHLRSRVEKIESEKKQLILDSGESFTYGRLLLANGASCFIPPFEGSQLDGVIAVRTVEDAALLRERCLRGGNVVVVGGGLLGLEMAAAIAGFVDQVTVVEIAPWLLVRQLDEEGGNLLQERLEDMGLQFRTGVSVKAIKGKESVDTVELDDGGRLKASVVVVSAGIKANTSLAESAKCSTKKGVLVDSYLSTDVEDIYAAGDCIEHDGKLYGIWSAAEEQGKIAGENLCGGEVLYQGTVPSNRLKVSGIDVFSVGQFDPKKQMDSRIERGNGTYRKLVYNDEGKLVGAILIGDLSDQRSIARQIEGEQK